MKRYEWNCTNDLFQCGHAVDGGCTAHYIRFVCLTVPQREKIKFSWKYIPFRINVYWERDGRNNVVMNGKLFFFFPFFFMRKLLFWTCFYFKSIFQFNFLFRTESNKRLIVISCYIFEVKMIFFFLYKHR